MAVYFIADRKNSLIKIGVSINRDRRIRELQTGNPYQLEFMGWIEDETHDFTIEKELHNKYHEKCCRGEWFSIDQNDVIHELTLHHGFIPKNENVYEIVGYDRKGIPEYLGIWDWHDFEIEECCPFCGCLCGMHYKEKIRMYYCINCDTLTNFEDGCGMENL